MYAFEFGSLPISGRRWAKRRTQKGALVAEVEAGSRAEKAGIKAGSP
jgi:S1-C subfamily serine protease